MEVRKEVAFDVRVGAVQINPVVTAAEHHIVQELKDGTRPLRAGKIDHIAAARIDVEYIAVEDKVLVTRDPLPVDRFVAADGWKIRIPDDQ